MGHPETTPLQQFILSAPIVDSLQRISSNLSYLTVGKNRVIKRLRLFNKPVAELGTEPLQNSWLGLSNYITFNVLLTLQSTLHLLFLRNLTTALQHE